MPFGVFALAIRRVFLLGLEEWLNLPYGRSVYVESTAATMSELTRLTRNPLIRVHEEHFFRCVLGCASYQVNPQMYADYYNKSKLKEATTRQVQCRRGFST